MALIQSYSKMADIKLKLALIQNNEVKVINLTHHICLHRPNSKWQ